MQGASSTAHTSPACSARLRSRCGAQSLSQKGAQLLCCAVLHSSYEARCAPRRCTFCQPPVEHSLNVRRHYGQQQAQQEWHAGHTEQAAAGQASRAGSRGRRDPVEVVRRRDVGHVGRGGWRPFPAARAGGSSRNDSSGTSQQASSCVPHTFKPKLAGAAPGALWRLRWQAQQAQQHASQACR